MRRYFLDLFAGIGGFALGAYWAGMRFEDHYFSEVDSYAISVYRKRFPDAIPLGDIKAIRGADLPAGEWIIAGGFPCQDISVAGKGAGLAGARSGLWYEYARLIGELRPRFAIMENVGALAFRGLDSVLGSLASLGYDAEWQDIRASDVGAPHRRERLWIVAYPNARDAECGQGERPGIWVKKTSERPDDYTGGSSTRDVADAEGSGCEPGRIRGRESQDREVFNLRATDGGEALADPDSHHVQGLEPRSANPEEREGPEQGQAGSCDAGPRGQWAIEPDVGRVAHGIPARVDRLKCLGNSIVPEIAELIFREIGSQL